MLIARRQHEAMGDRDGGNGGIGKTDRVSRRLRARIDAPKRCGRPFVKCEDAPFEQRQHLIGQCAMQFCTPPTGRQCFDTRQQLGEAHGSEKKRLRQLLIEPVQHGLIGCRFERLGDDIRIDNNHSKLADFTRARLRRIFNSTPPTLRPISASADPIPAVDRTVFSRMCRTSASVLRGPHLERAMRGLGDVSDDNGGH